MELCLNRVERMLIGGTLDLNDEASKKVIDKRRIESLTWVINMLNKDRTRLACEKCVVKYKKLRIKERENS